MQALVFDALKKEMPKLGGKDKKQRELIAGLEEVRNSARFGATLRNSLRRISVPSTGTATRRT